MKHPGQAIRSACKQHAALFLNALLSRLGATSLVSAPRIWEHPSRALSPVIVDDYKTLTVQNKLDIRDAYNSTCGVAYIIVRNPETKPTLAHPLFHIVEQLKGVVPVLHPLPHPMEGHAEAVSRFGQQMAP